MRSRALFSPSTPAPDAVDGPACLQLLPFPATSQSPLKRPPAQRLKQLWPAFIVLQALPARGRLVPGHCVIVPADHVASTRQVDEQVDTVYVGTSACNNCFLASRFENSNRPGARRVLLALRRSMRSPSALPCRQFSSQPVCPSVPPLPGVDGAAQLQEVPHPNVHEEGEQAGLLLVLALASAVEGCG